MAKFEQAVIEALGTLPPDCWQRSDGLMTESVVMKLYPVWFARLRLWLLEWRGVIEGRAWRGLSSTMRSYRLAPRTSGDA